MCDTVIVLNNPSKYISKGNGANFNKEYNGFPLVNSKGVNIVYAHIIKGRDTGETVLAYIDDLKYNELIET